MTIAEEIAEWVLPVGRMHGDLHTGNVLYNTQNDHLTLLDPRGQYGDHVGTIGDNIYDWAKLAQDCVLGYNHLLEDRRPSQVLARVFERKIRAVGIDPRVATRAGAVLLASAIPMHADDRLRQERFAR